MRNIIFDFDSTLIKKESLEMILEPILKQSPEILKQIENITNMGMNGEISFEESLNRRLALVKPTQQIIDYFVSKYCPNIFSDGMVDFIKKLHKNGDNIWIFSGGLADSIRPFAKYLNIPINQVYAIEINWNNNGDFISLNNDNSAVESKVEAIKKVKELSNSQKNIIIGDGFTDYQLYETGKATKFIAYIEHIQRKNVINIAKNLAKNVNELENILL